MRITKIYSASASPRGLPTRIATIVVSLLALSALAKTGDDVTRSSLTGGVGGTKTISAVNLLLPISTCSTCGYVRHEIKATNGCY